MVSSGFHYFILAFRACRVLFPEIFIKIFFARLSTDKTFLFKVSFLNTVKNFVLATESFLRLSLVDKSVHTSFIMRPNIVFRRPLVVVSTSGSSGMLLLYYMKKLLFIYVFLTFLAVPTSSIKADIPVKILLVPGHDNEVWGAQYGSVKEADMNRPYQIKAGGKTHIIELDHVESVDGNTITMQPWKDGSGSMKPGAVFQVSEKTAEKVKAELGK